MKNRIQAIMEAKGMAQNVFAQTLDLSPATISSIFTGRTNPTNNHVQAIHRAFPEINTNWLMFGEGEMYLEGAKEKLTEDSLGNSEFVGYGETETPLIDTEIGGKTDAMSLFPEFSGAKPKGAAQAQGAAAVTVSDTATAEFQATVLSQLAMLNKTDKVDRKIKEIRVFYNDGTFEAFAPLVK